MRTTPACLSSLHCQLQRLRAGLPVLVAASLLALLPVLQGAAWAQMPGQYGAAIDPPGRVASLNLVEGAVSFAPADAAGAAEANAWTPALLNRPLTSGDRLWTAPHARSELHIGSTAVRMSEQTSLDFLTLDDNTVQLRLAQGSLRLRVRTLFEGERLEINTPNLAFVITQPGDYRLDANPASNTTRVVAQSGAGVIYGDSGETVNLDSQQQASFTGTQLTPAGPGTALLDDFDVWAADRDQREDQSVSARYVPRETIGYQQLDSYGDWRQDATYGAVWLPRAVPLNWAPYRMGHWSWIAPWGWTWIDDAPWGFAPCHYGRWAQIGPRWAWVPGRLAPRPVYAPALVVFVGGHGGRVNWNLANGTGGTPRPSIGWFPLAPGEAFLPAYRVSPRYVAQVNHNIAVNNTVNVTNIYRYQRQPAAVTAVSRDDFAHGRPVHGNLAPLSSADLSRAQVVTGGLAEGAANRGALPQRPDFRERPRPAAAAALPPAALMAAQPVVRSRDERRDQRRDGMRNDRGDDRRDARKNERPEDRGAAPRAQTPALPSPLPAAALPGAQLPAARPGPSINPQDRPAIDAENRVRREQQQLQRDQERQQGALIRQQEAQRRQADESLGQRALREQAQKNANLPPPPPVRPADQDARAAPERSAAEQAQRAQQQHQRDQQRQQAEQARQQEQQRRQNDELASQRTMREQAQRQQALQQQEQQREQARRMQEQQQQQQVMQQQALQQQRAQQDQQRKNAELLGQRALREQAQRQQEQQRQQQALQLQQQQQQRVQQDQQRQAHEQQQRLQQEQRRQLAEEKPHARQADAVHGPEPRPEGRPKRHKEE